MFSSSPTDVEEATHFNVQPTISWLSVFASFGFCPDALFDAGFITPHAMMLRRSQFSEDHFLALFSELICQKMALASAINERDSKGMRLSALSKETAELRESVSRLSNDLLKILDSPAWKLVQKYRAWRLRHSVSHARIFAFYEALAAKLLARYAAFDHGEPLKSEESKSGHGRAIFGA